MASYFFTMTYVKSIKLLVMYYLFQIQSSKEINTQVLRI